MPAAIYRTAVFFFSIICYGAFLLVFLYSIPLWIHDLWAELRGPDLVESIEITEPAPRWPRVAAQAALCGVMFAAILVLRSQSALNFIYFAF